MSHQGNLRERIGNDSRGLWIAFFGPDGVGKSAVIDRLPAKLGGTFSGFHCFHFRPRFGRKTVAFPVTAPHAQEPRGWLISTAKIGWWVLDCWLGYLFLVRPARRRCHLVIFDRYLPDLLVDPVRYRLPPTTIPVATWLVKLAPQPDVFILLDAPADKVQARKQEVTLAESQRQRQAYSKLFGSLPRALVVDADRPVGEVANAVATIISSFESPVSSFALAPLQRRNPESQDCALADTQTVT